MHRIPITLFLILLMAASMPFARARPQAEATERPILVVSSMDQDLLDFCAKTCKAQGLNAVFKRASDDGLILNRVRSQSLPPSECPQILYGISTVALDRLAEQGMLQAYKPAWAEEVPSPVRDRKNHWYGVFGDPMAILYNRKYFETDELMEYLPEGWEDLGLPRFRGTLLFEHPTPFNPTGYFFSCLIDRAEQEHKDQEKGLDLLSLIDCNTLRLYKDREIMLAQLFSGGDGSITTACLSTIERCAALELPAEFCLPEEGFFLYPRGMALMKDASGEAKSVYEAISSQVFLTRCARKFDCFPLILENSYSFSVWPGQQISLNLYPTDHDSVRRNIGAWIGTWQNLIHGQGNRKTRVYDDALNTVMTFLVPAALILIILSSRGKLRKKKKS